MKKWIFCALVLAVIPVLSFGGLGGEDIGKLQPVQVVAVSNRGENVQLLTDTADLGCGRNVDQAVANMKETSSYSIFLDTAEYLLVETGAEIWLSQLQEYLRPSCNICLVTGEVDPEQAGAFLQLHEPGFTMTHYEAGEGRLPYLIFEEGRMKLVRP